MYEENVNLDTLFYDYSNFVRCKNTMQDKIGSALEYLSEELTFHAKELSSEQQESCRKSAIN